MTSPTRFLSPSPSPQSPSSSDMYMMGIVASLLCALICIAGLALLVRCAWVRRHVVVPQAFPSSINKGVQKRVLNTLPKLSFNADEESTYDDCAICLTDFENGEQIRVLPRCGHGFHVVCIDTWLKSRSSCPTCRQVVVSVSTCLKCGAIGDSRYLP